MHKLNLFQASLLFSIIFTVATAVLFFIFARQEVNIVTITYIASVLFASFGIYYLGVKTYLKNANK